MTAPIHAPASAEFLADEKCVDSTGKASNPARRERGLACLGTGYVSGRAAMEAMDSLIACIDCSKEAVRWISKLLQEVGGCIDALY